MNSQEIKQQLLHLENRDIVRKWFKQIHNRTLSLNRAMEINSAARQSSEFFRNATQSNYIVRPLLSFYGINSLSRALVLLLKAKGGENTITNGHGLSANGWNNILYNGELQSSLKNIGSLYVTTSKGLFTELVEATSNQVMIHTYSSEVNWSIPYDIPPIELRLSLNDLISRIPDFDYELESINIDKKYCIVNELSYYIDKGLNCKINSLNKSLETYLIDNGFALNSTNSQYELTCSSQIFESNAPLFLHKYVNKTLNTIPQLYLVEPFAHNICFSEIAICYILSYFLGILVRYHPTHWNALVNGSSGDAYWPVLNRAQYYVENVFPELVIEFINHRLKSKNSDD